MTKKIPQVAIEYMIANSRDPLKDFDWKNAPPTRLKWAKAVQKNIKDAKPIEDDFRANGVNIESLSDLGFFKQYQIDKRVLPLAMKWLTKTQNPSLRSGLVSAIIHNPAVKETPEATQLIFKIWNDDLPPSPGNLRDMLGNYVDKHYSDIYFEDVAGLLSRPELFPDKERGQGITFLYSALSKTKKFKPEANRILISHLSCEPYPIFIVRALARLKSPESIPTLKSFLSSSDKMLAKAAQNAINKIESLKGTHD